MFWVISVYFNIRNTLPKSCTFLLGHPVYIYIVEDQWFWSKYFMFLALLSCLGFKLLRVVIGGRLENCGYNSPE